MNLTDFLEKWGRTLLEKPLATSSHSDEPPELAEVRLALLDQIREKSYPSGGKKVFPFDLMRVRLRGVEESSCSVFAGRFFRQYLEHEMRQALSNAGCRYPDQLRVDVEAIPGIPSRGEPWMEVETSQQEFSPESVRHARLLVREGVPNTMDLRLDKSRINIGRTVDVFRSQGLFRRNDLAFEADTETNRSVSREHAHILHDKATGEYRLFNDRWYPLGSHECGTWIVRDGLSQEVHRTARGTKLESGDEIHFGMAVVVFELP